VLSDGVVSYSIDGTLLWEGELPDNFDKIRFGLASVVDTGMTQIVNSLEIKTIDTETIDDEIIEPEEIIDEEEIIEPEEIIDEETNGWQSVNDKTVKCGDQTLTAENPKGYVEDGKFINNAAWTDGPHFYVTNQSWDRMSDLEINLVTTGFANTIITPVTAPNWHCGFEELK
jgi:hypothetical protein